MLRDDPLPIIKEQLLPWLDVPLGIDADPVFPADHHHLGKAVRVDGVVSKSNLVALPRRINHVVCISAVKLSNLAYFSNLFSKLTVVEIEEETAHVFIVDLATSVSLLLGDYLMRRRHKKILF